MAYFEVKLAKLKKKEYLYRMKTLNLHTNNCLPTQRVWAEIIMFKS